MKKKLLEVTGKIVSGVLHSDEEYRPYYAYNATLGTFPTEEMRSTAQITACFPSREQLKIGQKVKAIIEVEE